MANVTLTTQQVAQGYWVAAHYHARFLPDAKRLAEQLKDNPEPAPKRLVQILNESPDSTWADLAEKILRREL